MSTIALFSNNLRTHDNAVLEAASQINQPLICLYCVDPRHFQAQTHHLGFKPMGGKRWQFLHEALQDLAATLETMGQRLVIICGRPERVLLNIIRDYKVKDVIASRQFGSYEDQLWAQLQASCSVTRFHSCDTYTLFSRGELGFSDIPSTFSKFRKKVESLRVSTSRSASLTPKQLTRDLPSPLSVDSNDYNEQPLPRVQQQNTFFSGGESAALAHVKSYFTSRAASTYKETRNALSGWSNSCKFSPWLAQGSLSAKYVLSELTQYEEHYGSNESTYWIYFELLWREYFQWYADHHRKKLFFFSGIHGKKPLTSFYPQRFQQWSHANTPWPLVNACMNELNTTGYLSNRGRQIVASCLVNELCLDWRYGAAYFEQELIDYDVASNWGNWQYIAGVGADPRGGRHFNIDKQTALFDPDGAYIQHWTDTKNITDDHQPLDNVDMVDWPIRA